jgi:V/A-type H+-transporting ATPase subunit I
MRRVALVAPASRFRRAAVAIADAGTFEPDPAHDRTPGPVGVVAARAVASTSSTTPELSPDPVDADQLAATGDLALLLGEASLEARTAAARDVGHSRVLAGWTRGDALDAGRATLAPFGATLTDLPGRRGLVPPTAHAASRTGEALRPLVTTYATVPYRDVDPTLFAALAYVVMFGMMFGDVVHGLAIVIAGVVVARARAGRIARLRRAGPFLIGAGASATVFGLLYGEALGPTGLVPTLWLRPLDRPETLLVAGLALGAVLLAVTFVLSIVNRWREGGAANAIWEPSGIAGALVLLGAAAVAVGAVTSTGLLRTAGWMLGGLGTALVFVGLFVAAGARSSSLAQAVIELFDTLLRLGSNLVSFTRLAAFGLTHAVISEVVWNGTSNLWDRGSLVARIGSVVLLVGGNVAAFALGALVAAIQALRLEYYEIFSRLFVTSGRPFDPWHVTTRAREEP